MTPHFGVGGFPPAWYKTDYRRAKYGKHREGIFPWLRELGLDWLELECTHGVKMPIDQARSYAVHAKDHGVSLSIHAPYYCVLSSRNPETVARSKRDLVACFELADILGATRIIFHPGYPGYDRERSLEMIAEAMLSVERYRPSSVRLYPEIGGKTKQLGSVTDIIELCQVVDSARPCLDLAHLHAREQGRLTDVESIISVLDQVEASLGRNKLEEAHYHVYPISFNHNGEVAHLPDGTPMATAPLEELFVGAIKRKGLSPTVISEATNSQELGAQRLKRLFGTTG